MKAAPAWSTMTLPEKTKTVKVWLFQKFSMDSNGEVMYPLEESRRKKISESCWKGFYLKDDEFQNLVTEIMQDYRHHTVYVGER